MRECTDFINLLVITSSRLQASYQEVLDDWQPEEPPVTTLFAALGDRIAEDFSSVDIDVNRRIFSLIEKAMESDNQELVSAVATGLIEALATQIARQENLWERVSPFLGPRSRLHAEAWLAPL